MLALSVVTLGLHAETAERNEPASPVPIPVGAARIDITPRSPIRLDGYANRVARDLRVARPLQARALAIGSDQQGPVLLVTVDLLGITEEISDRFAAAMEQSHRIGRARIALCATHTHTGPAIRGLLPFGLTDLTDEDRASIAQYTDWLHDRLIEVATAALAARQPASLAWAEGRAGFALHRRVVVNGKWTRFGSDPEGPVDHTLPVMVARDARGKLRAAFVSYACHCTTSGGSNFVHPDWAGEAGTRIETAHPEAVALVGQGCGGDANPWPRGSLEDAARHGAEIAAEVERLLATSLRPLGPVTEVNYRRIALPLEHTDGPAGSPENAAAKLIRREIAAGRPPPPAVPYPVQTWSFGRNLTMVFLAGEVVSEYSLRLRREFAAQRLWVNAYANSVPCYISSRRMYSEGGYEVDLSMSKYGWPARLAIETEDLIVGTVREMVPPDLIRSDP